ncbi:MAG: hypothetical protein VSS75_031245 [Candidatus Parabeggiatoa sp.]|nr:hypothetical protein [Candidatus Parabeggiatoa sp.]
MDIEIVTTKRRLTKSLLKQMHTLPYSMFDNPNLIVLGYIRSGFKQGDLTLLLKFQEEGQPNDYYIIDGKYKDMDGGVGYTTNKGTVMLRVMGKKNWLSKYNKLVQKALAKGQIYI